MNLSIGIYGTAGDQTCAGYPASLGHEHIDAADFASWGIDYLKYDNCHIPKNWTDEYKYCTQDSVKITTNGTCNFKIDPDIAPSGYDWRTSNSYARFQLMKNALAKQNRDILYSMCIWGTADVFDWGNETAVNWRMSADIKPHWENIMSITNINSFKLHFVNFWGHNDADMLEVGNGNLTSAETRSHFALWAAMKSPLLIGTDLTNLSMENIGILKNQYLLAFNQDEYVGEPAMPYKWGTNPDWTFNETWPAEYWSGASSKGTLVLLLNPSNTTVATKEAVWNEIPGLGEGAYQVTDVWTASDLGCVNGSYSADVAVHDTAAILVGQKC